VIRFTRCSVVSVALVVSTAFVPAIQVRALAQDAAPDADALTVQPGSVDGSIVDLDGKTPIKGVVVKLLDKDGKVVAEGSTDENGVFKLGKQDQGTYTLNVGQATGKLVVKEGAQATSIKFVLENQVALGAKKDGATKLAAVSTTGVVLIAVGAAVIGLGAGIGIAYGVWGHQTEKHTYIPVNTGTSPASTAATATPAAEQGRKSFTPVSP
jgi:hypothetical protein